MKENEEVDDILLQNEKNENEIHLQSKSSNSTNITSDYEDEIEDVEEDETKPCCCVNIFYYLFCCCCCECCQCSCCAKKKLSNNYYIKKWRKYLNSHKFTLSKNDAFTPLTKFFAKSEDAITELKKVRLNPDLSNSGKIRNDLEFYIPQLCTFILFGEVIYVEEFFAFLCRAANLNFFFAQRVHWFLSAMINVEEEKRKDIINILQMINTLFKSEENNNNNLINFYISMSNGYLDYINENNLNFLYEKAINSNKNVFDIIDKNSLNNNQFTIISKYKNSREKIYYYSSNELENEKQKLKNPNLEEEIFHPDKLQADDFFIDISNFQLSNEDITYEISDSLIEKENECHLIIEKKKTDLNFVSYHSSINFIEHLCDISNELSKQPIENQMEFLYEKITEINKKLPCNVYLPFLNDSCRNYFICHIPLEGASIFRTKTRCPIMLTFELIRISDISAKIYGRKNINIRDEDKLLSNPIYSTENSDNVLKIRSKNDIVDFINKNVQTNKKIDYDNKIREIIKNNLNIKNKKNNEKIMNTFINRNRNIELFLSKKIPNYDNSQLIEENEIITIEKNNRLTTFENTNLNNEENQNQNKNENQKEITIDIKIIKNVFGNTFKENGNTIKQKSLFGNIPSHKIFRCIIKTNEDLRQEQFATQLINEFYQIFKQEKVNCWLNTYEIISTGNNSGLVEMVNDSISIDQLKQKTSNLPLNDFFIYFFDKKTKPEKYKKAMNNYIKSLAGYSLLCYFLQIKDRHNGNILLDRNGHIIHIDFGFLLSNAPGKGLKFETAPFKLTKDMIDVLGGENSEYFHKFKQSIKNGFKAIINNKEKILILVEMMWCGHGKNLPCFEREQETIIELRNRLEQSDKIVEDLINQSIKSWTTTVYDYFQYYVQGINC
jgi:phosphatidylinositol 4-kinase